MRQAVPRQDPGDEPVYPVAGDTDRKPLILAPGDERHEAGVEFVSLVLSGTVGYFRGTRR